MKQNPFPKPPPVDPLPLKEWLKLTDRAEVGREPFFRGRDSEYRVFRDAVSSLGEGHIGGGTMVFQGAPGAGKTALMLECMESIRSHSTPDNPWVAVDIKPENLESATEIVVLLVDAANAESERLSEIFSGSGAKKLESIMEMGRKVYQDLSIRGVGIAGISVGGKSKYDGEAGVYSQRIFQNAAGLLKNFHTVVFVDEAQNTPVKDTTKGVLDCLHNPPSRIPLIAAFFGLGDTEAKLEQCGLSRLPDEHVANLRLLSEAETSDAIKSMFDAYEFVGQQQDREAWIECLVELSQGWPQHINRVAVAAARVIYDNGGKIEGSLLEKALEDGRDRKKDYYARRLQKCSEYSSLLFKQIAQALKHKPHGISRSDLFSMSSPALSETRSSFDEFLMDVLHAGVLTPTTQLPDHYQIPIPSFGDYLCALPVEPLPDNS